MSIKLALIRQKYRPDGGAEQFISRALSALHAQNLNLTIIARSWEPQERVHFIKCNPPKLGRVSREKGFAKAVCEIQKNNHFDLVQSHERLSCCDIFRAGDGVHRVWLKQRSRVMHPPAAWWMQNSRYHRYVMRAEQAMFQSPRLKKVICNSKMVKQEIIEHFHLPPEKIEVIYNEVDLDYFSPELRLQHNRPQRQALGIPEEVPVMIFVGSGFERKGLASALAALAKPETNAHLIIVGKDKRFLTYRKLAKKLGIENRVHFMGVQSDVRPFYGTADVLLLPTLYDPFPNVVLEAMACGLAVVTSTKCGGAEIIEQGIHGYIADALDIWSMSNLVKQNSQKEWRAMGQAARQKVESLELHKMGEKLASMYSKLLFSRATTQKDTSSSQDSAL